MMREYTFTLPILSFEEYSNFLSVILLLQIHTYDYNDKPNHHEWNVGELILVNWICIEFILVYRHVIHLYFGHEPILSPATMKYLEKQ